MIPKIKAVFLVQKQESDPVEHHPWPKTLSLGSLSFSQGTTPRDSSPSLWASKVTPAQAKLLEGKPLPWSVFPISPKNQALLFATSASLVATSTHFATFC